MQAFTAFVQKCLSKIRYESYSFKCTFKLCDSSCSEPLMDILQQGAALLDRREKKKQQLIFASLDLQVPDDLRPRSNCLPSKFQLD